jgi:hypothetical protein
MGAGGSKQIGDGHRDEKLYSKNSKICQFKFFSTDFRDSHIPKNV